MFSRILLCRKGFPVTPSSTLLVLTLILFLTLGFCSSGAFSLSILRFLRQGHLYTFIPQCDTHQRLLCTADFTKFSEFTEGNYSAEKEMIFQVLQMSSVTVSKASQTVFATGRLLLAVDLSLKPDPLPGCPRSLLSS